MKMHHKLKKGYPSLFALEKNKYKNFITLSLKNKRKSIPVYAREESFKSNLLSSFILSLAVHFIAVILLWLITAAIVFFGINNLLTVKHEKKIQDIEFILIKPKEQKVKIFNNPKQKPITKKVDTNVRKTANVKNLRQTVDKNQVKNVYKSKPNVNLYSHIKHSTVKLKNGLHSSSVKQNKLFNQESFDDFSIPMPKIKPLSSGVDGVNGINSSSSSSLSGSPSYISDSGTGSKSGNRRGTSGFDKDSAKNIVNTYDISSYVNELQRTIKWNWKPPKGMENKKVELFLRIAKDGKLIILNVKKTSEIAEVDNAALNAVKKSVPLQPLPSGYKKSYLNVVFTFDYNVSAINSRY